MLRLARILIALPLAISVCFAQQSGSSALLGEMDAEWEDVVWFIRELQGLTDATKKLALLNQSEQLRARRESVVLSVEPLVRAWDEIQLRIANVNADIRKNNQEWENYKDEVKRYDAAGGGGVYKQNDPKLAMLNAWVARLNAWHAELTAARNENDRRKSAADVEKKVLFDKVDQFMLAWQRDCRRFALDADTAIATIEINARLEKLAKQLALDRKAIEYYKDRLLPF